jgi:hypothetical protein
MIVINCPGRTSASLIALYDVTPAHKIAVEKKYIFIFIERDTVLSL